MVNEKIQGVVLTQLLFAATGFCFLYKLNLYKLIYFHASSAALNTRVREAVVKLVTEVAAVDRLPAGALPRRVTSLRKHRASRLQP